MTTYAIAAEGQIGRYPTASTFDAALARAFSATEFGMTVTVLKVEGPDDDLTFTPVVTLCPPITPTTSTSPEVRA